MVPLNLVVIAVVSTLLSLPFAVEGVDQAEIIELPECEYNTEVQFYTAEIDILNLPEACNTDVHLFTIGFFLQETVDEVEERLPRYKEEQSSTDVCPFPNEVPPERRRRLQTSTYRYRATGRCRRCKDRTTARARVLQSTEVCAIHDETEFEYDRAKYAYDESSKVLIVMEKLAEVIGTKDANELYEDAGETFEKCREQLEKVAQARDIAFALCETAKRRSYSSKRLKKAREQAEDAMSEANKAENYLVDIIDYQNEIFELTDAPTSSPVLPTSPQASVQGLTSEEYLNRLSANLENSNTACEPVKQGMVQKTIAEETVVRGDKAYGETMKLAVGLDGNVAIETIKGQIEKVHFQMLEKAAEACAAADLASDLCVLKGANRSLRKLADENEALVQAEVEVAASALLQSRLAFMEEKALESQMEEVRALSEFAPEMSQLEASVAEDEAKLVEHKGAVETKISQVDSQIQALSETSPEVTALEAKKDSLAEEDTLIENVLLDKGQFLVSQSALKKDEYYESVAPDFNQSPPLQYILRSRQVDSTLTVEKNWNDEDETSGSKEDWFRRFGDDLVVSANQKLMRFYNTLNGGCIPEDTELSLDLVVTEVVSVWEALASEKCRPTSLGRQGEVPTPAPTPGAPTTCNVDEAEADACTAARADRNKCGDAMDYWERESNDESMGCARIAFEREQDCGVCLPPTMTGVDLCGTADCTAEVLFSQTQYGTCGERILYHVMQENISQDLACKSLAVGESACRQCLPQQPQPVCTETCTDEVLNTFYNGNGDTCGSGIAYWLRREPEEDACARVAVEQSHVCACCHPDPAMRPNNCETGGSPAQSPTTCNVDEAEADACTAARADRNKCGDAMDYWERESNDESMGCARIAFEREQDCGVCLPPTMTGVDLCGTADCTAEVLFSQTQYGTCGERILYHVMQENISQDLACKSLAVGESACRQCLPQQPQPVCTETCTDEVLNTFYNGNGDTCGSGIAYWLRREPEEDACARVAVEQSHVCACCHPDPAMRPNNCETGGSPAQSPTTCNVDEADAGACTAARADRGKCGDAIDYWEQQSNDESMACARIAFEREQDCGVCLPPTMTGVNLCGTAECTAGVLFNPSSAGGTCGSGILYYVMQENLSQDLACKSVAVEQSACRPCLPPQPDPVCAETCTDAVLNTVYNGNGDTCGSGIAYWLRRESEGEACARVANEQSHVCQCCHPDPAMRPNNC